MEIQSEASLSDLLLEIQDDAKYVSVAVRKGLNQQDPDPRYLHTILRTQLEFIELVGGDKIKMPCLIEPDIVATPVHTPSSPAFKVIDIPGKGRGVVAIRDLKEGSLLFVEKPILTIDWTNDKKLSEDVILQKLEDQIAQLSQQQQDEFYSLDTATSRSHYPKPLAIFHSNAIGLSREHEAGGIFLQGSRFNHSCRHSAKWAWDAQEESMYFILNRNVKEGEEITVGYMEPLETAHRRQMMLKSHYGFVCSCEACTAAPNEIAQSDQRRTILAGIMHYLDDPLDFNDLPLRYHALCIQGIKLFEEEDLRLDLEIHVAYAGFMLSIIFGYEETAQIWIDYLLELQRRTYGAFSIKFKLFELLKEDLTCHPAWRFMERLQRKGVTGK